jgi:hypothetical protein
MEKRDLGINRTNGRIGVLLPDHLVDFGVEFIMKKGQPNASHGPANSAGL